MSLNLTLRSNNAENDVNGWSCLASWFKMLEMAVLQSHSLLLDVHLTVKNKLTKSLTYITPERHQNNKKNQHEDEYLSVLCSPSTLKASAVECPCRCWVSVPRNSKITCIYMARQVFKFSAFMPWWNKDLSCHHRNFKNMAESRFVK